MVRGIKLIRVMVRVFEFERTHGCLIVPPLELFLRPQSIVVQKMFGLIQIG